MAFTIAMVKAWMDIEVIIIIFGGKGMKKGIFKKAAAGLT